MWGIKLGVVGGGVAVSTALGTVVISCLSWELISHLSSYSLSPVYTLPPWLLSRANPSVQLSFISAAYVTSQ